ncbi:uncharacterized protein LOC126560607 [Anopheles maculipalpis]|uniref:uncharacterized protein LOC126560607 n=1 Tax=Anopheles maculipalpis TaxID=1496333 RepID=UPI0021594B9F|nr:uncharacterized protein LOC126560607 [Anopheles maculipalpis]
MRLGAIFSCVLFLAVTVVSCMRIRNDRTNIVCRKFNRQIQIFRPQGLVVTQRVSRNLRSLDLELYINQKFREHPSCDVCANATVTNGTRNSLIIKHPSVIILPGDTIQYSVTKSYRHGPPKRFSCEFGVNGDLMKFLAITNSPRSCTGGVPSRQSRNYEDEQKLLWDIIYEYDVYCDAVELTNLLVLPQDKKYFAYERDIKEHIVKLLSTLVPSIDWAESVRDVYRTDEMYFFGMKSILLKHEILHMIQGTSVESIITDFDKIDRFSVRNTDGSRNGNGGSEDYVEYGSGLRS